jgi:hypothetical protein
MQDSQQEIGGMASLLTTRMSAGILALLCAFSTQAAEVKIPEGTDVRLQFIEKLSSSTATEGQRFNLIVDEDVRIDGVVVVPSGSKAVGTVVSANKKGFMGKAGELNVLINYMLLGDQRIRLRASKGKEGEGRVGATVALTVLFGPLGLLKRGKDIEINPGTVIDAFVDETITVNLK